MSQAKNKKVILSIFAVILLLIIVVGVSYAVFTFVGIGVKENVITSGSVTVIYTEGNELHIENAMPISDEAGKVLTGDGNVFTFTVQANLSGDTILAYEVSAVKKESSTLLDDEVKLYLEKNNEEILSPTHYIPIDEQTELGSEVGSMVIDSGTFTESTTNYYTMKMWVDEGTEITDVIKFYTITVNVYAKDILKEVEYTDEECFVFEESTGTITEYKCGLGNTNNMDYYEEVLIPPEIKGVLVQTIGDNAFRSKGIKSVRIPDSVTSIKVGAFNDNLFEEDEAFIYARNSDGTINKKNVVSYAGEKRDNIIIPEGVVELGAHSFNNLSITSITLPSTLKIIRRDVFYGNPLTSIVIPDSVTEIGIGAFNACKLTNVKLPNNLIAIEEAVFNGNDITHIEIPNTVQRIGPYAFAGNELSDVVLPDSVLRAENSAFSNNKIKTLKLSNNLQFIGRDAFSYNQLTSITIPSSVLEISGGAFWVNQLTNVVVYGKTSTDDFTAFGASVFGWASGYSSSNIVWQN